MAAPPENREDTGYEHGGLQCEGTVVVDLGGQAGSELAVVLTGQCFVVSRGAHWLGRVGWWVLCRVGCCRHPWLRGHGVVALVRRSRVAWWHTWRLRVRGVYHSGGRGGGYHRCKENPSQDRPSLPLSQARVPLHLGSQWGRKGVGILTTWWPAAHLVETAAGTREADDEGDHSEHKDGQANGYSCPKPAKEPVMTSRSCPGRTPHHPQGHPSCQRRLWAAQSNFKAVQLGPLSDCVLIV